MSINEDVTAMKIDSLPIGAGRVTFWDLNDVDPERPLAEQTDRLKEDLIQIEFDPDRLLDVGWYPSFSPDGKFAVVVIENGIWEQPLYRESAIGISDLKIVLSEAISVATQRGN